VTYDSWLDHNPRRIYSDEALATRVQTESAQVVICEVDRVGGALFELPVLAVGVTRGLPENVDIAAATRAGVPVINTPARNADGVAELTIGLILAAGRKLIEAHEDAARGEIIRGGYSPSQRFRGWEIQGQTLGLIGFGAVGRAVAWRARGLGMRILAHDPYVIEAAASLDQVLSQSDIISVHSALIDATSGLIGQREFSLMKPGAIYINTARSQIHDSAALVGALESNQLSVAALDHTPSGWHAAVAGLCDTGRLIITPHIGGATFNTEERQSAMMATSIAQLLAGDPVNNVVNPEVLHES
jgi:D-3-phosphoglycerate dehydrogenase